MESGNIVDKLSSIDRIRYIGYNNRYIGFLRQGAMSSEGKVLAMIDNSHDGNQTIHGNGHGSGMGHRKESGRYFGRGHIQYALLEILNQQPMHGYQIMKELEVRSDGLYIPSPGSIYPTLQMLEDQEYVCIVEQTGKKVYHITEAGQEYLQVKIAQKMAANHRNAHTFFQHEISDDHLRIKKQEILDLIAQLEEVASNDQNAKIRMHKFFHRSAVRLREIIYESKNQQSE